MDVKTKAAQPIGGYFSGSFDAKLHAAISKVKGISMLEKIKLLNAINEACLQQVGDCCEALSLGFYLNLHDIHGFGFKRLNTLQKAVQATIDGYADKYEVACVEAMRRDINAFLRGEQKWGE